MANETIEQVFAALAEVKAKRGQWAVRELLNRVAGVNAASQLRPEQYAAVVEAAGEDRFGASELLTNDGKHLNATAVFARWNRKRAG